LPGEFKTLHKSPEEYFLNLLRTSSSVTIYSSSPTTWEPCTGY
jgi:hypothetical protein